MKKLQVANTSHRTGERGSILAYTVISALVLFLAVGLAVDLGHLYTAKTELQNASDAAALAGAFPLDQNDDVKIDRSVCNALKLLNLNKYNFDNKTFFAPGDLAPCDDPAIDVKDLPAALKEPIRFAENLSEFDNGNGRTVDQAVDDPHDIRFIKVITPPRPISIFFSIPVLGTQRDLSATAVAGYSVPGNTSFCILPMSAVSCNPGAANCKLECRKTDDPATPDIDEAEPGCKCDPTKPNYPQEECKKYWGECPNNPNYLPINVEPGGLDPNGDGKCDPQREFCKGCKYTIRSEPSRGPAAGAYNLLACAGKGACDLRKAIAAWGKCKCQANAGEDLETLIKPGQVAGPVRQGLNVRFDIYNGKKSCDPADADYAECTGCQLDAFNYPPDMNVAQPIDWDDYFTNSITEPPPDNPPGKPKRRVLIIPIVPVGEYYDGNGRQYVRPSGFGGFFLQQEIPNGSGEITVEYIAEDIVDVIGFDPNGEQVTNIVTPVLYR